MEDQNDFKWCYVKLLNFTNTPNLTIEAKTISWVLVADELPTLEQNGKRF
jgi:hypothetical protein